ncbi:hypothetical protein KJQ85_06955 [Campylobacter lari]|uniref:hypothetical protein n=1 Tax=Campylobacter lari TaxID=201 RepID=UPI001BDB0FA8|nr:hypothetical protein [Campylobacter lari]MBT0826794.1 hypothetical protein [Campylobacter lari]
MLAKAFNQVLKANAKISVYEMRGILGDTIEEVLSLDKVHCVNGQYIDDKSSFEMYSYCNTGDFYNTSLTIFGYKSEEDAQNANIKITYTPTYNGSLIGIYENLVVIRKGNGQDGFLNNLFGRTIAELPWLKLSKQNNGIYKFEDLNNKYIKPTYLHLKLP